MLVTDKNIIAIRAGEYTYTSQTDPTPPVSFNIYGVNIKNITIVNNYSGSAKKAIGIDLRGLHNSNID